MGRRVLVVEDRQILAESLARAMEDEGMEVVLAMQPALESVVELAREREPEIALVALGFGPGDLTERAIGALTDAGVPSLVMTGGTDRIRMARCVAAGAVGIIHKTSSFDAVAAMIGDEPGITALSQVEMYKLQDELRRHRARAREQRAPLERLTPQERTVLHRLTEGMRAGEIAEDSCVSISTVRTQIRAILTKLGVTSQLAAVAMANRGDWFDSSLRSA